MAEAAEKISITMTPDMIRELRASVESGEYASTSEALRDAVRLWRRERTEHAERLAAIRARIARSVSDERPSLSLADARKRLSDHHERILTAHDDEAS
ncbi:ribbon-helix-helix protein, CopG family [Bosea sp. BK604]|uniref:ribbon-helix-helix domain-containing protein n=1 Tax=Bosea sp. BK604 TaxID=2512180 RepID=UPI0010529B91|nr:ribbon-helix-helix protein, CopG family [Bosea sp. BK604]TCR65415.1 antitoxin ParD1/3/4 [Bosea sp. BK604]